MTSPTYLTELRIAPAKRRWVAVSATGETELEVETCKVLRSTRGFDNNLTPLTG